MSEKKERIWFNYLEFFDAELNDLDVCADVQFSLLLQLFLRFPQPRPDVIQVRVQLLPLLLVLLGAHLFTEILSLQELPALNHTWMEGGNRKEQERFDEGQYNLIMSHEAFILSVCCIFTQMGERSTAAWLIFYDTDKETKISKPRL